MKTFSWSRGIGLGVLIWIIMAALVWLASYVGILSSAWTQVAAVVVAGVISYMFATGLSSANGGRAFEYGLVWAVIGIVLDLVITSRFSTALFSSWAYWLGYAFILFAPLVEWGTEAGNKSMRVRTHVHSH